MIEILNEIDKTADEILDALVGTYTGPYGSGSIMGRLASIEESIYSGSGKGLIIGSAAIATILQSTNYASGSTGWQIEKSGDVEFNNGTFRGTIYASAGEFSDVVYVGTAADRILIDGANKNIRSEGYVASQAGFKIDYTGDAEFNNVIVRGSIVSSVFNINEVTATAGTQMVAHNAGILRDDATATATTFNINIDGLADGTPLDIGDVGDAIRLKDATNSTWGAIASKTDMTTYYQYTITYHSGSSTATYYAGNTVLNYGANGEGYLWMTAEGTGSPRLSVYSHAGSPWTTVTERVRLGNLNGWGPFSADTFGLGVGDYSGGDYLFVDPAGSTPLELSAAGGSLILDQTGLKFAEGSSTYNAIRWMDGALKVHEMYTYDATPLIFGINYLYSNATGTQAVHSIASLAYSWGTNGIISKILLNATDSGAGDANIEFYVNGNLAMKVNDDSSVTLDNGTNVDEFSTDGTLAGNSDDAVPTEKAVKTYVDGPSFRARLGSNQSIATATWTTVQFDTEDWDTDSDYATGSYLFTPSKAGIYDVDVLIRWSSCGAGDDVRLAVEKNGSTVGGAYDLRRAGGNFQGISISVPVSMNGSTDTLRVRAYQGSGAARQIDATSNTYFAASFRRPAS